MKKNIKEHQRINDMQWGEEVEVNAVFNGKGYRVRLIPHFETEAFRPISKDSTLESVVVVNVEKEEKDSE